MTPAQKSWYTKYGPRPSGRQKIQAVSTGVAGASVPLFTNLAADAPLGRCWVVFEADQNDAYVQFRTNITSVVTQATGAVIPFGIEGRGFWLVPTVTTHVDVVSPGGVGALKWWVSSPPWELG